MILAVFDTNVLASCAIAKTGSIASLRHAWQQGTVRVVVSSHILGELERTLGNAYFASRLDTRQRERFLDFVRTDTMMVIITASAPNIAATHGDNLILATAGSGGASFIVTGDAELLRLGAFKTVAIVSARQFLGVLEVESTGMA